MDKTKKNQEKFAKWYELHGDERNAKRRDKYRKNKAFREAEKKRVQAHRESNPSSGPRITYRELDGKDAVVVRIGEAANRAGTSPEIIRRYEAEGLIPLPTWDDEPQRLYTHAQCKLIKEIADLRRETRAHSENEAIQKLVARIFKRWNYKWAKLL